jgi:hypothetical protein
LVGFGGGFLLIEGKVGVILRRNDDEEEDDEDEADLTLRSILERESSENEFFFFDRASADEDVADVLILFLPLLNLSLE